MGSDPGGAKHPQATANAAAAAALAAALTVVPEGGAAVCHVVASPGSRHTPLLLALAAHPAVVLHMVLDERAAGFIALGLARATGRAAVLCCTSGSAGSHYLPAVVEADAAHVPLVIVTGDRPAELQASGAPQTMPQGALFGGFVRWACSLPAPQVGPGSLGAARVYRTQAARALARSMTAPAGPVHLNAPLHEPLWAPAIDVGAHGVGAASPVRMLPGEVQLGAAEARALAALCLGAQRGLMVCGPLPPGPAGEQTAAALAALAVALGWPLLADAATPLRMGPAAALGTDVLVSTADVLLRQPAFAASLPPPDCILRFGMLPTAKGVVAWLAAMGSQPQTTTVLVEPNGSWQDPDHVADVHCACPPAAFAMALAAQIPVSASRQPGVVAWRGRWTQADRVAQRALRMLDDPTVALGEAAVARCVVASVPAGGLLHVASSMPIRDVEAYAPGPGPAINCSRGVNGIDGTLATVLGLALAWRQGPVVALVGDLAFLHDIGALQAARQLGVCATVVVANNGGGDIFAMLPIAALEAVHLGPTGSRVAAPFETLFRTPQKADMGALCRAAGTQYRAVRTLDSLRLELGTWPPAGSGLRVIEVQIEPQHSRQLRQRALAAVGAALQNLEGA